MNEIYFIVALALSIFLFTTPKKYQYSLTFLIQIIITICTSYWASMALFGDTDVNKLLFYLMDEPISFKIDKLSAFFVFTINLTVLTGTLYARGYLKPYYEKKSRLELAWHYFNLLWLYISMLLVVMLRNALAFLIVWELMSLSSFFLVMFESEKKETIKIGIKYLLQMHIGLVFILAAFLWTNSQSGGEFSFDGLAAYFNSNEPFIIFTLFFIGFGIKAGFIPFHTWLPHAHPAAPSHVSGIMSGVMLKMGIYGILRVLTYIHSDLFPIGLLVLITSLISGVLGVTLAIVQNDLKKLLAYSSIENIGIIGIGIGLGIIGMSLGNQALATLGFAGGILHIFNHSLFKSLLFYSAGNVYGQTHTRNIEQLGGLIKKMPKTALLFLLGALAICALPPFNGFISEFIIYSAMFKSFMSGDLFTDTILLFSLIGLAVIGGLAIFCFTKVFSIVFLGTSRCNKTDNAVDVPGNMLFPGILICVLILTIGIFPFIVMKPLSDIISIFAVQPIEIYNISLVMNNVSVIAGIFIGIICLLWLLRAWQQKKQKVSSGNTWGCGYTGANPAFHQYTATSFADNFVQIAHTPVNVKKEYTEFTEDEIFPDKRSFQTHSSDIIEDYLVSKPFEKIINFLEKTAIFQTGKIQHYLLYALLFAVLVFILTILNWL